MADQLLSRDPTAGQLVSSDPSAATGTPPSGMPPPAGWQPAGTFDTSDAAAPPSQLAALLGQYAHPQTLTDFARILSLPVDQVRRALGAAMTMATARSTAEAVGTGATAAGRGVRAAAAEAPSFVLGKERVAAAGRVMQAVKGEGAGAVSAPGYPRGATTIAAETPAIAETAPAAAPAAAVDEFTAARTARAAEIPPPVGKVVPASGKMQLTAPEFKEFTRMVNKGIPHEDALTAVRQMRQLARQLGGATDAEMAAAIAHRGTTGKW